MRNSQSNLSAQGSNGENGGFHGCRSEREAICRGEKSDGTYMIGENVSEGVTDLRLLQQEWVMPTWSRAMACKVDGEMVCLVQGCGFCIWG